MYVEGGGCYICHMSWVEGLNDYRKRVKKDRREHLDEKVLHDRFFREIKEVTDGRT